MAEINIGNTSYSIEENWLKTAIKFFEINQESDSAINLLKAGLFGYNNEIQSNEIKNNVFHRNILYDEHFINTASFPESINNFAKLYNVSIDTAVPAHVKAVMTINKADILNSPYLTSIDDGSDLLISNGRNQRLILKNDYTFMVENIPFKLPYPIMFDIRYEHVSSKPIIVARYYIEKDEDFPFMDTESSSVYLKTWNEYVNSETENILVSIDLYQLETIKSTFNVTSNDVDGAIFFTKDFTDQLAYIDIYYNKNNSIRKIPVTQNNTFDYLGNEDICYYTVVDDNTLQISFSSNVKGFRPEANTEIIAYIHTTKGSAANFSYAGAIKVNYNNNGEFDKIPMLVTPITDSSGGTDKLTLNQIKTKIIQTILTRNNIITTTDLEYYFNKFNIENQINGSRISFFKKRDDFLKRMFTGYVLMKDGDGKIVPTNTAKEVTVAIEDSKIETAIANTTIREGSNVLCDYDEINPLNTKYYLLYDETNDPNLTPEMQGLGRIYINGNRFKIINKGYIRYTGPDDIIEETEQDIYFVINYNESKGIVDSTSIEAEYFKNGDETKYRDVYTYDKDNRLIIKRTFILNLNSNGEYVYDGSPSINGSFYDYNNNNNELLIETYFAKFAEYDENINELKIVIYNDMIAVAIQGRDSSIYKDNSTVLSYDGPADSNFSSLLVNITSRGNSIILFDRRSIDYDVDPAIVYDSSEISYTKRVYSPIYNSNSESYSSLYFNENITYYDIEDNILGEEYRREDYKNYEMPVFGYKMFMDNNRITIYELSEDISKNTPDTINGSYINNWLNVGLYAYWDPFYDTRFSFHLNTSYAENDRFIKYKIPYTIKMIQSPTPKAMYYNTSTNKEYFTQIEYMNPAVSDSFIINRLQLIKEPGTYNYKFLMELNTSLDPTVLDNSVYIRAIVYTKLGVPVGYLHFDKYNDTYVYTANMNTNFDAINNVEQIQITNGLFDINKNVSINGQLKDAWLDDEVIIKIAILYNNDDNRYKYEEFSSMGGVQDHNTALVYSLSENVTLFTKMEQYMESTVYRKGDYFYLKDVPLVESNYYNSNYAMVNSITQSYCEMSKEMIDLLENNDSIDIKFYNTYGPSMTWYKHEEYDFNNNRLKNVAVEINLVIKSLKVVSNDEDLQIKNFIARFIEDSNKSGIFARSNLLRALENNFEYISYIEFDSVDYSDTQKITKYTKEERNMTKQEILDYVPEYLNVRKHRNDHYNEDGFQYTTYDYMINISYK